MSVDGAVIPPSLLNMRMPLDPGEHALRVAAPGHISAEQTFTVEGADTPVTIPALEPEPEAPVALTASSGAVAEGPDRTWAWVSYGVGAAGLAVGVVGLIGARSAQEKLDDPALCNAQKACLPAAQEHIDSESFNKTLSLAGFVVGGLGIAAGTTFLLIPGSEDGQPAQLEAYLTPSSGGLRGSF